MIAPEKVSGKRPQSITVRVKRQDAPGAEPYWELHRVSYEREMNVISVLQKIAAQATTIDGKRVAPVAWECGCLEEVCGSCTMVINGKVRQSCSALVDRLMEENPDEIVLEPMSKFPVLRDLQVDRRRLFRGLQRVKAWVPVDGYYDMGAGPRQGREDQEQNYPLSQCMSCGCCLEACPQFTKIELVRMEGESDEAFERRQNEAFDQAFVGANAISQAVLFNNHPTGKNIADERLDALTGPGGIATCGNAQNCVAVCPKEIPLTTSIAKAGRAATIHTLKRFFDR
jgi:succinate dehydrogenase / fumarate reductase iron-sulfur subunit